MSRVSFLPIATESAVTSLPDEPATAAFVVDAGIVESNVYGVGGAVVVGTQKWLLVGPVADNKVHDGTWGLKV